MTSKAVQHLLDAACILSPAIYVEEMMAATGEMYIKLGKVAAKKHMLSVRKAWIGHKKYELMSEDEGSHEGNYTCEGVSLSDEEVNRWIRTIADEDPLSIWKAGVDATIRQFGIDK